MNKILLVDDDRELTSLLKSSSKWKVLMSWWPTTASRRLSFWMTASIYFLLDVMMPKKNGIDTLKALRQTHQTPVIMLTARGSGWIAFSA